MGVTGSGKTTVGHALAESLNWEFADADDFHSPANVAKMRTGIPLDDNDRAPWLASLRHAIAGWLRDGTDVVLACSALKQVYREELMVSPEVRLVYLRGSRERPALAASWSLHGSKSIGQPARDAGGASMRDHGGRCGRRSGNRQKDPRSLGALVTLRLLPSAMALKIEGIRGERRTCSARD